MSFRSANSNSIPANTLKASPVPTPWIRNKCWLTLPSVASTDKTFVGLHAVWPDSNFVALSAAGNYYVDWGDGTNSTVATGVQANHQYTYADAALDGTDGPVTFQDTGDTVTRTSHGYVNGDVVAFWNIVSTTGITQAQQYYIVNKTTDTFQISLTAGGSAVALTTDGSGTLLPYKQAIVVVTPQSGQTFTGITLNLKNSQALLNSYGAGWLDIIIAGTELSGITLYSATIKNWMMEQAQIVSNTVANYTSLFYSCINLQSIPILKDTSAAQTSYSSVFRDCKKLQKAPYLDTSHATSMAAMFQGCNSLISVPLYDTHLVTNFNAMFRECFKLTEVPLFNMSSAVDVSYLLVLCYSLIECPPFKIPNTATTGLTMFQSCGSLKSIPMMNFSKFTSASYMFQGCVSLTSIPEFDFSSCTTMDQMFNGCYALKSIPKIDTSKNTNFSYFFAGCAVLESVPDLDTHLATNTQQMFDGCKSLKYIPTLNLPLCTNISYMFRGCYTLQTVSIRSLGTITNLSSVFQDCYSLLNVEAFSTSAVTTAPSFFLNCGMLKVIPPFDLSAVTVSTTNAFNGCSSLAVATMISPKYHLSYDSCCLGPTALTNIINSVAKSTITPTLTLTNNWGNPTSISLSAAAVTGSTTMLMASTTGLVVGMEFTGVGSPLITPIAVTTQGTGDTVTLNSHGLSDGDEVSFATLVTTTGIVTNTIYYVINSATNTFKLSLNAGGSVIDLVTDGTGTIRYRAVITTINTNTSVVLSRPATSTSTTVKPFHTLAYGTALLRGWTVTG